MSGFIKGNKWRLHCSRDHGSKLTRESRCPSSLFIWHLPIIFSTSIRIIFNISFYGGRYRSEKFMGMCTWEYFNIYCIQRYLFFFSINKIYIRHLSRRPKLILGSTSTTFEDNSRRLIFQSSFNLLLVRVTCLARPSFGIVCSDRKSDHHDYLFTTKASAGAFTSFVTYSIQSWFGLSSMRRFQFRGIKTRRWDDGSLTLVLYRMYQMSCRYPTSLAINIYGSEKVRYFPRCPVYRWSASRYRKIWHRHGWDIYFGRRR